MRSTARRLRTPCPVALLLFLFLVGCGGASMSARSGIGHEQLRYSGRTERHPFEGNPGGAPAATPVQIAQRAGLPTTTTPAPPMPLQAGASDGLGNGIPRAVLRLVPRGATTAAEAGTSSVTGEALVAGGAVVAAGGSVVLVCLTVKAAREGVATPVDIADTFYGTHLGDLHGWVQGCYAPKATATRGTPARTPGGDPVSEPREQPAPVSASQADRDKKSLGRIYVTYTKFNSKSGRYYSGRTSMVVDLRRPLRPQAEQAVDARDVNHHVDENDEPNNSGFRQAVLDEFDVGTAVDYANRYSDIAYWRIRGREQQLMDSFGGAQSDTQGLYRTENVHRGVAKDNPLGKLFHDAAAKKWGQLYPYTGD